MQSLLPRIAALMLVAMTSDHALARLHAPMNVVFILVDDLGWSDLGCYGSSFYETRHIDRFAQSSLRFTQAYAAAPVCSPTRAAILTGKYPARLDMTIWHEGAVAGGPRDRKLLAARSEPNLTRDETTLGELFRSAGYFTAHIGKWHLGTAAYYPETQGFDLNIGGTFWGAPSTFFFPFAGRWSQTDPETRYVPGLAPGKPGDYLPDRLTDKAIEIVQSMRDRPFFLNLWYYTVHTPIEAPDEIVNRYRQKSATGTQSNPTYAAMVERMDHNVGRILQTLQNLGLADRTIVVLTSDNGGVDIETRTGTPTSNSPLRSGKGTLYEGGIRVPLLVHWPALSKPGTCTETVSSQDFFPTFIEYLRKGQWTAHETAESVDGYSLLPLISNPAKNLGRSELFWHFPHYYPRMTPGSAIRRGDWKAIHSYEDDSLELYNLKPDPGEEQNLEEAEPSMTTELRQSLDQWRQRMQANSPRQNHSP